MRHDASDREQRQGLLASNVMVLRLVEHLRTVRLLLRFILSAYAIDVLERHLRLLCIYSVRIYIVKGESHLCHDRRLAPHADLRHLDNHSAVHSHPPIPMQKP
jgi:hypothetical protein